MGFRENMAQVCQLMNLLADIFPMVILIGYLAKEPMNRQTTNFNFSFKTNQWDLTRDSLERCQILFYFSYVPPFRDTA